MRNWILTTAAVLALSPAAAFAHGFHLSIGLPGFGLRFGHGFLGVGIPSVVVAPPIYVAPAPVYAAPVVVGPPAVYAAPPAVFAAPPVVYAAPRVYSFNGWGYAPAPAGYYYGR